MNPDQKYAECTNPKHITNCNGSYSDCSVNSNTPIDNHLDNDKEELRIQATEYVQEAFYETACGSCDHPRCDSKRKSYVEELLSLADEYTQSKLKAFAGDIEQAVDKIGHTCITHKHLVCGGCEAIESLKAIKERWNI